ncbi:unnamed protein product, partial [Polarella glacialis]
MEISWPCCVICPTSELVALGQSLSSPAACATIAAATGLDQEVVRLLGRRLPSGPGPQVVVCWLARGQFPAPARPPRQRPPTGVAAPPVAGSRAPVACFEVEQPPTSSSVSTAHTAVPSMPTKQVAAATAEPAPTSVAAASPTPAVTSSKGSMASAQQKTQPGSLPSPAGLDSEKVALHLLRQLLAEPRLLCGPGACTGQGDNRNETRVSSSCEHRDNSCSNMDSNHQETFTEQQQSSSSSASASLAAALRAGRRRGGAWGREEELTRQLKIELLEESLQQLQLKAAEPSTASSSLCSCEALPVPPLTSGVGQTAAEVEERLLSELCRCLQAERDRLSSRRHGLANLRVAERRAAERCAEIGRCL